MTLSLDKICRDCASRARQGCGSLPEPSSFVIATVNQGFKTKSEPGRASLETGPVGREVEAWGTRGERGAKFAGEHGASGVCWGWLELEPSHWASGPHQLTAPQPGWLPRGTLPGGRGRDIPRRGWEASARRTGLCDSKAVGVYFRKRGPSGPGRVDHPGPAPQPHLPALPGVRAAPVPPPRASAAATWNHPQVTSAPRAGWAPPPGALLPPGCSGRRPGPSQVTGRAGPRLRRGPPAPRN